MDERRFQQTFTQFLNDYWGAFHELLEAESVTPARLADSLFQRVLDEHTKFVSVCPEPAKAATETLGALWRQVADHRQIVPDDPLSADQVRRALEAFRAAYDQLHELGRRYPAVRTRVLKHALHSTPKKPLRPDAAS